MVSAPINSVVSIANEKETYESLVIQMFNMVTAEELVDDINLKKSWNRSPQECLK